MPSYRNISTTFWTDSNVDDDFTPEDKAGQFQGIRMIFYVLLPMVIGPALGNLASASSAVTYTDEYGVSQNAPTSAMFLCAALVAVLVFLPLGFLIKNGFTLYNLNSDKRIFTHVYFSGIIGIY